MEEQWMLEVYAPVSIFVFIAEMFKDGKLANSHLPITFFTFSLKNWEAKVLKKMMELQLAEKS